MNDINQAFERRPMDSQRRNLKYSEKMQRILYFHAQAISVFIL